MSSVVSAGPAGILRLPQSKAGGPENGLCVPQPQRERGTLQTLNPYAWLQMLVASNHVLDPSACQRGCCLLRVPTPDAAAALPQIQVWLQQRDSLCGSRMGTPQHHTMLTMDPGLGAWGAARLQAVCCGLCHARAVSGCAASATRRRQQTSHNLRQPLNIGAWHLRQVPTSKP